jgi:uncharacterized protein (TIGR02147 family)
MNLEENPQPVRSDLPATDSQVLFDSSRRMDLFAYVDYRAFLRDHYLARKALDRKYSHRYIMDKVGASSPSWFNDLIKGRINLTGTFLYRLAKMLDLKPNEEAYFESLVFYDQAGSLEEKNHYLEKILSSKGMKMDLLTKEKFEFYGSWFHAVIRELLSFVDFRGDFAALARRLNPAIKKDQASRSVELLLTLGMIRKEAGGRYRPTSTNVIKDARFKSLHLANYLKSFMELGMQALDRFGKENRDVSAMTMSLSPEGFEQVREELKATRQRIVAIAEKDKQPHQVYQLNLQFFPTTQGGMA